MTHVVSARRHSAASSDHVVLGHVFDAFLGAGGSPVVGEHLTASARPGGCPAAGTDVDVPVRFSQKFSNTERIRQFQCFPDFTEFFPTAIFASGCNVSLIPVTLYFVIELIHSCRQL